MPLSIERRKKSAHYYTSEVRRIDLTTWYYHIYQYLTKKEYPPESSPKAQQALRLLASQFFEDKGKLYIEDIYGHKFTLCNIGGSARNHKGSSWWGVWATHEWPTVSQKGSEHVGIISL